MIILFEENEQLFTNLGLGILKDAKSCNVVSELNDSFEVELVYPYNGVNYDKLKINRIIYCKPNPYDEAEPFRIYSISKPIKDYVTLKAQHISYDMNGLPCNPISGNGLRDTIDKIQNGCIIDHNFKIYTEKSDPKTFKTTNIYNMRALLMGSEGSVLEKYDLEIKFNKFNVYLSERIGANRGASISYAKNLKDITHEINYERLYNGVYPFYHQETTETTTNTSADGFKQAYIVGSKPFQDGWLSYSADGEPYHPIDESPIQIATEGNYYQKVYCWNANLQRYQEKVYNEMVTLMDSVTGLLGQDQETPQWVVIDWSEITSLKIVCRAGESGYFKMSTDTEWTYYNKGEIVFQGSIKEVTNALILYYSEVIPPTTSSEVEESTNVTHIELSEEKIIWIDTPLAKSMKINRILSLDLTSEFEEAPDEDALKTKALEYIEKKKIGQYKFDTTVSFVDLTQTTEGAEYKNINHIELGDTVRVTYNSVGIDVELRVVSTKYDAINNKYISINLGEKPEKLSADSIQQGDGVSSLTNDVGYADITTVNKLVAKIITADYIKAKNADLTKAQIEQLETARINCTGIIEASQFVLDELVAKLLTADNAVIKETLEAGIVKVNGDITVSSGSIKIQNIDVGTSFLVDRDGNVTANSVNITGGSLKIQDSFEVTNDGELTAINARIVGNITANSGNIAGFEIQNGYLEYAAAYGTQYVKVGIDGIYLGPLDPITNHRKFEVGSDGILYARDANLSGSINATSGTIAGFTINNNTLTAGDTQGDLIALSSGFYFYNKYWFLMAGGRTNEQGDYVSALFGVAKDGTLLAYAADISGNITAQSGNIAGFSIISDATDPGDIPTSGYIEFGHQSFNNDYVHIGTDGIFLGTAFSVTPDGALTANSGNIAGFDIGIDNSNNGYIKYEPSNSRSYVYLGTDKIELGKTSLLDPTPKFSVNNTGQLIATDVNLTGVIHATRGGSIAGFDIYDGCIKYEDSNDLNKRVYIGTTKIELGSNSSPKFRVTNEGILTATDAILSGTITASAGNIAGMQISSTNLEYSDGTGRVYIGTDKIELGTNGNANFSVTKAGYLTAKSGLIGSLTIESTGLSYANAFQIDTSRANYTDPRTPQWVIQASTMQINQLNVGHNSYGESDYWISFISSKTKFDDSRLDRGGMLIHSGDAVSSSYCYYPSKILSSNGFLLFGSVQGDFRAVKKLINISITRYSGWSNNSITYDLSGYGSNIITAMISVVSNNGFIANPPLLSWSGSSITVTSDADVTRKYFELWVIIEQIYTI